MKPQVTLTQLEEEPETGFFGLTFAEIKVVFMKSFLVIITLSAIGSFFIEFSYAAILGMLIGGLFFWLSIKKTSGNRADKPLYYHRHIKIYKNHKLIIQPSKYYQRERTTI
ncbi:hypothetical protein QJU23_03595 [Pasteurella atlantica]|uniref:Uncharacterized protein n=2 Tax=Pasteurellaceae TaxID=712 RepID=A0ACC6HKW9_9PAST|nr:hypothetical protein [Pasteurella atlantica]MDP8051510.1 hypothetical protein [Pasteurella atlantica]MDP8104911.1 hypothetical protein [Pasteurella atlantica]MDP8148285.1 hypothetical protein [Pasteurella atlantica]